MVTVIWLTFIAFFGQTFAEIVKIDQGSVNGTILHSRNGTQYYAFYAIPYAAPPIGNLRFKPPAEPPTWTGVRQATQKGARCIQNFHSDSSSEETRGSEDCLYLSVFSRDLNATSKVGLPVMVFIHGGAFFAGYGDDHNVNPLMDKPIVAVTMNYRLGILGLLSSNDNVIPGNFALKDQTAALRWVQKNIRHFGGNPDSVTIFGQSSGSVSVHMHLMSPLSKGLFHRAIMESGSALSLWAYYNEPNSKLTYTDTIKHTNCTEKSTLQILQCLQTLPAEVLVQVEQIIKIEESLVLKYRPVIENRSWPGAFLTKDPHFAPYQNPSIPVIIGFTNAEGIPDTLPLLLRFQNMTILDQNLDVLIPQKLHYWSTTTREKRRNITELIRNFYFVDGALTRGQEQSLCDIMSDYIFIMPIIENAMRYPGPKYVYMYDYRNSISMGETSFNVSQEDFGIYGACHADELLNLFYSPHSSPKLSQLDIKFSERLVTYWTNFAYSGNPNIYETVVREWQSSGAKPLRYLRFNNAEIRMETNPLKKRHNFWLKCPLSRQYGK